MYTSLEPNEWGMSRLKSPQTAQGTLIYFILTKAPKKRNAKILANLGQNKN